MGKCGAEEIKTALLEGDIGPGEVEEKKTGDDGEGVTTLVEETKTGPVD